MRILEIEREGEEESNRNTIQDGKASQRKVGKPVGRITIDDQDISEIGLHHVRKNLSIIPQDPFLLEGSVRFNVDPFGQHSEESIVKALESVGLLETLRDEDIIE